MYCSHCGTNNPEGTSYCIHCGSRLSTLTEPDHTQSTSAASAGRWKLIEYYRNAASDSTDDEQIVEELSQFICTPPSDPLDGQEDYAVERKPNYAEFVRAAHGRRAAPGRKRTAEPASKPVSKPASTAPKYASDGPAYQAGMMAAPKGGPQTSAGPAPDSVWYSTAGPAPGQTGPTYQTYPDSGPAPRLPKRKTPTDVTVQPRKYSTYGLQSSAYTPKHADRQRKSQNRRRIAAWVTVACCSVVALIGMYLMGHAIASLFYKEQPVSHAMPSQSGSESEEQGLSAIQSSQQEEPSSQEPSSQVPSSTQSSATEAGAASQSDPSEPSSQHNTSSQAPAPAADPVYKTLMDMNVRAEPNLDAQSFGTLLAGTSFKVIEEITLPDQPQRVWGKMEDGRYICLSDEGDSLCVRVEEQG